MTDDAPLPAADPTSPAGKSVLLVDDTPTTRRSLAGFLERELRWQVHAVGSSADALAHLAEAPAPYLVLLDQVLDPDDADSGTRAIPEILQLAPRSFVVVYTADPQIDERQRWRAMAAGAHRYIRKGSPAELLRDLDSIVQEVDELGQITAAVREFSESRGHMGSTLLGLGVQVSIVDRHSRVWFSNRPQWALAPGGLCWSAFHGTAAEWGPCAKCSVPEVIEGRTPPSRTVLARTATGELEWARVESVPIRAQHDPAGRVIGVREAYMPLPSSAVDLAPGQRLEAIADGLLVEGYGRVRIYRQEGADLSAVACATSLPRDKDLEHRNKVMTFSVVVEHNPYGAEALRRRDGTVWNAWDDARGGPDTTVAMQIDLEPPWCDLPVWDGEELIGWLSVDVKGARKPALEDADLPVLRRYRDEVAAALRQTRQQTVPPYRAKVTATRLAVAQASSAGEALAVIVEAVPALLEGFAACHDVRVRMRKDGRLERLASLAHRPDDVPIDESDPASLAAFVVAVGKPLYIDDCEEYGRRAGRPGSAYRPGKHPQRTGSLAVLPLKVEDECFGTLSVECGAPLTWHRTPVTPYLVELSVLAARVVRDLRVQEQLAEGKRAVERELEQAFGAIHGIKGPAQAARNALAVLEAQTLPPAAGAAAAVVDSAVARIERLAERLLRIWRPAPGATGRTLVTLAQLAEECRRAVHLAQPQLAVATAEPVPEAHVSVALGDLCAVFEELATNSTRAGATRVTLSFTLVDGNVRLDFDDDGRGIDAAKTEKIFARWYHEFGGGNGLGLPWARAVVNGAAGGTLHAFARQGGARLRLSLPLARTAA